jgi:hypothetical protein
MENKKTNTEGNQKRKDSTRIKERRFPLSRTN